MEWGAADKGKSQGRQIELMGSDFRNEVTKGDDTVGITKLVDGFTTRMER